MTDPTFAFNLHRLRLAAHMTGQELAESVGRSRQCLSYLEQGKREPPWSLVCALADSLSVPIEEFRREVPVMVV